MKIELDYIETKLSSDYEEHKKDRQKLVTEIFEKKKEITDIYKSIYTPVEKEIKRILNEVDSKINFSTDMVVQDKEFGNRLLSYVSKSYNGIFNGKSESINTINNMLNDKDFNNTTDILKFIEGVLECIYEDIDSIKKELKLKVYDENDNEIVLINNMNPNELLSKLNKYDIENLLIEEIPLEDLFMNYYK